LSRVTGRRQFDFIGSQLCRDTAHAVVDVVVPCAAGERLQLRLDIQGILAGQCQGLDRAAGAYLVASRAQRQTAGDIAIGNNV
jgi:hypothetical protein